MHGRRALGARVRAREHHRAEIAVDACAEHQGAPRRAAHDQIERRDPGERRPGGEPITVDTSGRFEVAGLKPGQVEVASQAVGFQSRSWKFTVQEGQVLTGPLGTARNEDEIQFTIRYQF